MFTKIIDREVVIAHYKGIDFKYHRMLDCISAMRLAKKVALADEIDYKKYWIAIDPTKLVMMKLNADKDLEEYNPTFKAFDVETVRAFVSRGKMPFHSRKAYWAHRKSKLVIISGTFVNASLSGYDEETMNNLWAAMETYNAKIKADVVTGRYGVGVEMMTFAESMVA